MFQTYEHSAAMAHFYIYFFLQSSDATEPDHTKCQEILGAACGSEAIRLGFVTI